MSGLIISNISWEPSQDKDIFEILKSESIFSIEIAISKYFKNWNISYQDIVSLKGYFDKNNISIYSLQSIFYNLDFNVFKENKLFSNHLFSILKYCEILGVKRIVFGAPKNRIIGRNDEKSIFIETMQKISPICKEIDVVFCIEPNSKKYGCNFITNSLELNNILGEINSPNISMHLDTACMFLENDDPSNISLYSDKLEHFHISEPYLNNFEKIEIEHNIYSSFLKKIKYKKMLSIEMKLFPENIPLIKNSIKFAKEKYKMD
jgi:sugar phosphate isomerase/epimerase